MGLKICQKIVEDHGGQINCLSEGKGQGSTFYFSMEMKPIHDMSIIDKISQIEFEQDSMLFMSDIDKESTFSQDRSIIGNNILHESIYQSPMDREEFKHTPPDGDKNSPKISTFGKF